MSNEQPLACDLSSIDDLEQHRHNGEAVFEATCEIREVEKGIYV